MKLFLLMVAIVISSYNAIAANELAPMKTIKKASQVIMIEETIIGSKEQPKFLTIVPWQSSHIYKKHANLLEYKLNQNFKPIEPSELKSQLMLLESIKK